MVGDFGEIFFKKTVNLMGGFSMGTGDASRLSGPI